MHKCWNVKSATRRQHFGTIRSRLRMRKVLETGFTSSFFRTETWYVKISSIFFVTFGSEVLQKDARTIVFSGRMHHRTCSGAAKTRGDKIRSRTYNVHEINLTMCDFQHHQRFGYTSSKQQRQLDFIFRKKWTLLRMENVNFVFVLIQKTINRCKTARSEWLRAVFRLTTSLDLPRLKACAFWAT